MLQEIFVKNLPKKARLYGEYHALLVELAKMNCRTKPECKGCPLCELCKRNI
jgi:endonuclease-3 related protein